MSEQKVLLAIDQLQGDHGVSYSAVGDQVGGENAAMRTLARLELKGLVHVDGEIVKLTALGAVVLQTYR